MYNSRRYSYYTYEVKVSVYILHHFIIYFNLSKQISSIIVILIVILIVIAYATEFNFNALRTYLRVDYGSLKLGYFHFLSRPIRSSPSTLLRMSRSDSNAGDSISF